MTKPLFLLQGVGTLLNRGSEAILRSTVSMLRDEFGPCRFINALVAHFPQETADEEDPDILHLVPPEVRRWRSSWFMSNFRRRVLRQSCEQFEPYVSTAMATLAIGGDNYSLDYGIPWQRLKMNWVTLRQNKPLVLWGASVGPFSKHPGFERVAAEQLKKVTLICARESETVAYLESIGISDNVRAVADPAFLLEARPVELADSERVILERPCFGLNLSPLIGRDHDKERPWVEVATDCVKALVKATDCTVVLVPHVVRPDNDDHALLKRVYDRLSGLRERLCLIGRGYTSTELKWIISHMNVFIGARTHSTIAALSSQVPTGSIGYSIKASGINQDIFGHKDWLLRTEELRPETLVDLARRLLTQANTVRRELEAKMPEYKAKSRIAATYLRQAIESAGSPLG